MKADIPELYDFTTYLSAKKSVDERSFNRQVWQRLQARLGPGTHDRPVRVLEAGCGIGALLERMLDWELLVQADYLGLDAQSDNITFARRAVPDWARDHGWDVRAGGTGFELEKRGRRVCVRFEAQDIFDFIDGRPGSETGFDLLAGHAFLDLLDIPAALPRLLGLLRAGGWFYFPITFDGLTLLEPVIDPALDEAILKTYHASMDERQTKGKRSGDSQAGRHLFQNLHNCGAIIEAAGSSDWVVFSHEKEYPAEEAYFLHFILHFFETTLSGRTELDAESLKAWLAARHEQVRRGELVYIAHQLDFCGRCRS
jgi:SAM-dependent methyltransferase